MKDETILSIAGIAALAAIEIACIINGIDHAITASITALIAGIAGYKIRQRGEKE